MTGYRQALVQAKLDYSVVIRSTPNRIIRCTDKKMPGSFGSLDDNFNALTITSHDVHPKNPFPTKPVPIDSSHTALSIGTDFIETGFL